MVVHESYSGELEILRQRGIADSALSAARREAEKIGISAAEYLVKRAIVSEAAIYSALAEHCGVPFVPEMGFRPQSVNSIPLGLGSLDNGPLLVGVSATSPHYVIAPAYSQFTQVRAHLQKFPDLAGQIRISTPSAIRHASTVMNAPSGDLESRFPEFSAKVRFSRTQFVTFAVAFLAFLVGLLMPKAVLFYGLSSLFSMACILTGLARWQSARATEDDSLDLVLPVALTSPLIRWPAYTVLVPLYREARIVPELVEGLRRLDYPTSRLEIKFLLEKEDKETREAFAGHLDPHMHVVVVPDGFPRTKPRALAYGLELAQGEFITIFDAEDQPQPDQLKKAALFFSLGPKELACLQARLAIDNFDESFFSRQYALEYACLFDQLIPWFHQLSWPFPLGGTSNHFRRSILDSVGGWDKYNVTEDADLGIRLARFGYICGVLPSTTYEEAPLQWRAWLSQRSRWYKGWLQTLCVHLRDPGRTCQEIGLTRLMAISSMIGGSFFMMALHPFVVLACLGYVSGMLPWPSSHGFAGELYLALCTCGALFGYIGAAFATLRAGRRRGYRPNLSDIALLPVYWLFTSLAFYRAVWEFAVKPFEWNKTEHGVSRQRANSRRGKTNWSG
ncbi:glycosyltransferase [Roseibium polysiphoniae]|uniref:Glycosyltransferase n=1 Tax=Roseibium polysiphoniae TaxID=2571221 RepID=A0A944GU50_9HYPH|nr:glycosyltransferase [Roseibium polysiphoniae]